MGQNTTTFNIDELISSYIDNQIPDLQLKSQIEEMLSKDAKLNAKHKSELLTKNLFSSRLLEAELPQATYQKVMSSIDTIILNANGSRNQSIKPQQTIPEYPSFWQSAGQAITARSFGVPRYAFAIVLFIIAGALLYVNSTGGKTKNPYILAGTENSIMVQAVNSFHKILEGDVKLHFTSSNAAEVEKYVKDNAQFEAYVPRIEEYELKGVVCSEYNGQKLAHLIYRKGDDELIYIYQTPVTAVQKKTLELPGPVNDEIIRAKFFMCDQVDDNNCTLTLWYRNNIVCASVSTMPKQEMHTAFVRFNK